MSAPQQHRVVIVGGGTAGISVAARLCKRLGGGAVAVIEPADKHYYQPLWTLVGGGICKREASVRDERAVMPSRAIWIKEPAAAFDPEQNQVILGGGGRVGYEVLVLCPGIQLDWHKIEGLAGNIGKHGICSNYDYDAVASTWPAIQSVNGGAAVFTHPNTPIKCGGAPQKIMYLAESTFRRRAVRAAVDVHFCSGQPDSFTVPHYARKLDELMTRRKITPRYLRNLAAVRAAEQIAVFDRLDQPGQREEIRFSMLHVTPPMSAPDFVKKSPFANAGGWIDVDKHTLRHGKYANVFGLGDASSLPTSKTGAAIRKQAPTCALNVLATLGREPLPARYDGYTSCPIVTDYGKLILAEFDYDKKLCETFWFDQSKERLSMYLLKKHLLPVLYWHGMLKGRA